MRSQKTRREPNRSVETLHCMKGTCSAALGFRFLAGLNHGEEEDEDEEDE